MSFQRGIDGAEPVRPDPVGMALGQQDDVGREPRRLEECPDQLRRVRAIRSDDVDGVDTVAALRYGGASIDGDRAFMGAVDPKDFLAAMEG